MRDNLVVTLYGESKSGKSTHIANSPKPVLVFDAENASKFLFDNSKKVYWNPSEEPIPVRDVNNQYEACIVHVKSFGQIKDAYEQLKGYPHPFRTIAFDSISEIQQKLERSIAGNGMMKIQDWGKMSLELGTLLRNFRDLPTIDNSPIVLITFIATSKTVTDEKSDIYGKTFPDIKGKAKDDIRYISDITGHVFNEVREEYNEDTKQMETINDRGILVGVHESFTTGNRVNIPLEDGTKVPLPDILPGNTTFTKILKKVFPELREYLSTPLDDPSTFTPGHEFTEPDTEEQEVPELPDYASDSEEPDEEHDSTEESN